jgi:ketosteroid isomerase-like protein
MSQENMEVVRQALAATSGGDPDASQVFFAPAIEWDMAGVSGWSEKRLYRGQEVGDFLRAWANSWRDWRFEYEDLRAAGNERVFAAIHEHGIGTESEAVVEQHRYLIFTLRGDRIVRVQMFSERPEALHAAGLSE